MFSSYLIHFSAVFSAIARDFAENSLIDNDFELAVHFSSTQKWNKPNFYIYFLPSYMTDPPDRLPTKTKPPPPIPHRLTTVPKSQAPTHLH